MLDKHPQIFRPLDHDTNDWFYIFEPFSANSFWKVTIPLLLLRYCRHKPDEVSENVIKQIVWTMKTQLELTMTLSRL